MNNIARVSLAALLLFSTLGITLNKHYCLGRLQSVALFQKDKSCSDKDMPCCENEQEVLIVDNLKIQDSDVSLVPPSYFLYNPSFASQDLKLKSQSHFLNFFKYTPPPLTRSIPKLLQSFLL